MALSEEVIDEYKTSLKDLHVNSKPLINMLTMLAEDHEQHAPEIVKVIEDHINKCKPAKKLPVLYLMDSIMKNLGDSTNYKSLFSKNIVQTFTSVFEQVDEKTRASMYKLRQTWTSILPNPKLYMIDVRINNLMDPAWPITASAPEKTSIHVNPKFLNKAGSSGSGSERSSPEAVFMDDEAEEDQETVDQEAIMRQQLIAKHQELLELQQARIQLELAETQEKLKSFGKNGSKTQTAASSKIANLPLPPVVDNSDLSDPLWNPPQPVIDPRKKPPDPRLRDPRMQMQPYSSDLENTQEIEGTVSSTVPYMDQSTGQVIGGQGLPPQHKPHQDFNPMDSMQYPHGVPPFMQRGFGEGQNVFKGTVFPEDAKFSDSNDSDSSWSSFQDNRSSKSAIQPKVNVKDPRLRRQLQEQNKGNQFIKTESKGSDISNKNRDPRRPVASPKTSSGHQHKDTKDSRQSDKVPKDLQSSRISGDNSSSKSPRKSSSDIQSSKSRSASKDRDSKSISNQRNIFEGEKRKQDNDREKESEKDSKYLKKESGSRHSDRSSRSREKSPGQLSKHQSNKTSHHKGGGDNSSSGKNTHDNRNKDRTKNNSTKGVSKKSESHSDIKRENNSADSKHAPISARSIKREKSSPQGDEEERLSKKPKLSIKEEPVAEGSEMEVEKKSNDKVSNDLSELFGSEDIDYRPVDQKGLPLKSPSSKGWDKYKASQPDQFAYDIELKKQRQDVDQRRTRQMSEASENQDTDLRVHGQGDTLLSPPLVERDIPKELSLSQHSEIIIQAQKQLREGKITAKQHQDLMQQVQELMQIQQKLQEENYQTTENTQGAESISESPSRNLFNSFENELKHQSPREGTNLAVGQGFAAEGGPRSPERPMERFRIPKKSHDLDSPKKDKRGLNELYPERIKEEAWESGPPVLSREFDHHPQRGGDPEWIAPPNLNESRRPPFDKRQEPRGPNFRRGGSSESLREHPIDYHKQHERRDHLEMPHDLRDAPSDMKHDPHRDWRGKGERQQYPHFDRQKRLDELQPENLNIIHNERQDHKLVPESEKEIRNDPSFVRSPRDGGERRQDIGQSRLPEEELQRYSDQKGPSHERQSIGKDLCFRRDGMDFNSKDKSEPSFNEQGLGHIEGPHIHPFDRPGPPLHRHEGPWSPPYGRPGPPHLEQNRQDPLRPGIERNIPRNSDLDGPGPQRSELDSHDSEFALNRVEQGFDLDRKGPPHPDLTREPLRSEFERPGPQRPGFSEFDRSRPYFERQRHEGPEIDRPRPPGPELEKPGYQGPGYDKMGSPRYGFDGHEYDRQELDRVRPRRPEYDRPKGHSGSDYDRSAPQEPDFERQGPPGLESMRPGPPGPEFGRMRPPGPELDRQRLPSPDLDRHRPPNSDFGRHGPPGPNFDRPGPPRPEFDRQGPPGPNIDRPRLQRPGATGPDFDGKGPQRPEFNRPLGPEFNEFEPTRPSFDRKGPSRHDFDRPDNFKLEFDAQGHPGPDFDRHRLSGPEFDRHRRSGPDFDRQEHPKLDFDRQGPPGPEFDRSRSGRIELERQELDREVPLRQDDKGGPFRPEFDEYDRSRDIRYGSDLDRHRGPPRRDLDLFHKENDRDGPPFDTHRNFEPQVEDENSYRETFDRHNRNSDQDRHGRRDKFDPGFDRFKHDSEKYQFRSDHGSDHEFGLNHKHGQRRHDERNMGDRRFRDEDIDKSNFVKAQENKKNESATGDKVPKSHKDKSGGKADSEKDYKETVVRAFDPNKGLPPWQPVNSAVVENARTIENKDKKNKSEERDDHAKKDERKPTPLLDRKPTPLLKDRSEEDRLVKKENKERLPSILDGIEPDLLAKQHTLEESVGRTRPTVPEGRFNPMPSQLLGIAESPNKKDHRGPAMGEKDERRGPGRPDKEEKRGKKDKDRRRGTDKQDKDDRRGQDRPGKGERRGQGRLDKDERRGPGRLDKDERRGPGRPDKDERRGPLPPQEVMDGYIDKYGDPRFRSFTDMGPEVSEEVVFGKRNYEIKLGAPPRKIQWGNGFIEVYADPSKRGVVIDNELMYRFGERVKEVNIRGKREKIFYHGKPLDIWIDGNNYEVRVDSPPKTLIINNQAHRIQVDGRDMMILIDKAEMGPYGGEPRFILIDDMRMELRFDPPPRHILIDGEMCELKLNVRQPCINIKGVLHGIRFKGPPRDVFINGSCYQVFTDHAVKLRVGNRFHYVALGGPCHELIVDGKWYEVKFDEPPKEINVGNRVLMVRIPGGPPEVKILDPILLESTHMPMFNPRPLRMPMPGQPMVSGPRPMGPPQQPMMPGMPGMMIGQPVSGPNPMVNPAPPGLQPLMGPPQTSVIPGIGNIIPGLQPSQPNPLPISSVGPTSAMPTVLSGLFPAQPAVPATTTSAPAGGLDINSLLSKLVSSGIIKKEPETKQPLPTSTAVTPAPTTKTDNSTIVAEAIKAAAAVKRKPAVTETFDDIPEKTSFDLVDLKEFHEGAIQRLYAGAQCTSCGARFLLDNDDKADRYKQHLDWHFRQNKLKKDDTKVARCRKWYYGVGDWIQYEEVTDLEDQSKSVFFEQQNPAQPVTPSQSQQIALITVPEGASVVKCPPATGNDQDDLCNICHEPFEQFWHEEHEEWHLRDAIRVNNKTYHPICYEDYTDVSEGTPSPSVLLDKQPDFSSRKTLSYEESSQDSVPHSSFEEERNVPNPSSIKTEPVMSLEVNIKSEPQTVNTDINAEELASIKMETDPEFGGTSAFSNIEPEISVKLDSGSDTLKSGLTIDQYSVVKQEPVDGDEAQGSNNPKSAIPGLDVSVSVSEPMETSEEKFVSDHEISTAGQEPMVTDSVNSSVSATNIKMESESGAESVESNQMDTVNSSVGESADRATPTLDEDSAHVDHIEGHVPYSHPSKSLVAEQTSQSVSRVAEIDVQNVSQIQNTDTTVEAQTLGAPLHHSSTLSPLKRVIVSQPADVIEISQEVLEISSNASTPTHDELPSPPSPGS